MDRNKEKIIRAAILTIPGIGSQRLRQLIAMCGSARKAWEAGMEAFPGLEKASWLKVFLEHRARIDPEAIELRLKREGISTVMLGEEHYPCLLAECSDAPPLLFYKGFLGARQEGLAIVGTRRATAYGKAAAAYFAQAAVESGYVVVSGLARGIDAAAHQGALEAGGITWAFLAGGLDKVYPPENVGLARLLAEKGALLSEYPPGLPAEAGLFPARNRLISGSSRGVIVVEAALRSGSLITVDFALEQGREVFAVPGPIFSEQSKGTHRLLKQGARLVTDKEDILAELAVSGWQNSISTRLQEEKEPEETMADYHKPILELLSDVPLHIDRLTALCPLAPQEIVLGLLELQLAGKIIQLPGHSYVLRRKPGEKV